MKENPNNPESPQTIDNKPWIKNSMLINKDSLIQVSSCLYLFNAQSGPSPSQVWSFLFSSESLCASAAPPVEDGGEWGGGVSLSINGKYDAECNENAGT